jgi:serine/threonine protein kinase
MSENSSIPEAHHALPVGSRLGEFEIRRVLGAGGFGIVYVAFDHALEREVAIKEYMPASLATRSVTQHVTVLSRSAQDTFALGLRSFVNEAKMLARFDHPSLVKVLRFWEENGTAYMAMPYYRGYTLRTVRTTMAGAPEEAWLRRVCENLLGAMEAMHREGVYHRDIAPDNIVMDEHDRPVLLDFGAARRVITDKSQALTAILKPNYAPIEQYAESAGLRQGPWTDIYALGATLHFLVTGEPPPPATARALSDHRVPLAHGAHGQVGQPLLALIDWMLAPRPENRPRDVDQVRAALAGRLEIPMPAPVAEPPAQAPAGIAPGLLAAASNAEDDDPDATILRPSTWRPTQADLGAGAKAQAAAVPAMAPTQPDPVRPAAAVEQPPTMRVPPPPSAQRLAEQGAAPAAPAMPPAPPAPPPLAPPARPPAPDEPVAVAIPTPELRPPRASSDEDEPPAAPAPAAAPEPKRSSLGLVVAGGAIVAVLAVGYIFFGRSQGEPGVSAPTVASAPASVPAAPVVAEQASPVVIGGAAPASAPAAAASEPVPGQQPGALPTVAVVPALPAVQAAASAPVLPAAAPASVVAANPPAAPASTARELREAQRALAAARAASRAAASRPMTAAEARAAALAQQPQAESHTPAQPPVQQAPAQVAQPAAPAVVETRDPHEACGGRILLALHRCLLRECAKPEHTRHAACAEVRAIEQRTREKNPMAY